MLSKQRSDLCSLCSKQAWLHSWGRDVCLASIAVPRGVKVLLMKIAREMSYMRRIREQKFLFAVCIHTVAHSSRLWPLKFMHV